MSSNLYYQPASKPDKLLPDELKHALRKLDEFNNTVDGIYGNELIPILRGMEAADVKGATRLIEAIKKYGEIELKEVW